MEHGTIPKYGTTIEQVEAMGKKLSKQLIMYACIPQWTEWVANFMEICARRFKTASAIFATFP